MTDTPEVNDRGLQEAKPACPRCGSIHVSLGVLRFDSLAQPYTDFSMRRCVECHFGWKWNETGINR